MTNKDRQRSLERKIAEKKTLGGYGNQAYCLDCPHQDKIWDMCLCHTNARTNDCYCAKAYNRMKRRHGGQNNETNI